METLLNRSEETFERTAKYFYLQTGSAQESDTVSLMNEMKFLAFKHKLRSAHSQSSPALERDLNF